MDNSWKVEIKEQTSTIVPINDIYLGYYSPTRQRVETNKTMHLVKDNGRSHTKITFGSGYIPSVFDYKVARAEQYIFGQTWSQSALERAADRSLKKMALAYQEGKMANQRRKNPKQHSQHLEPPDHDGDQLLLPLDDDATILDQLFSHFDELEIQEIALMAMADLSNIFFIEYTGPDIDLILGNEHSQASRVRRSADVRSSTFIQEGTTIFMGNQKKQVLYQAKQTPLAYVTQISPKNATTMYRSRMNEFILFNRVGRRFIDFDINNLKNYQNDTALLLAEFLYMKFFGTVIHGHEYLRLGYTSLCNQLLLKPQPKVVYASRQFQKAFEELKQSKVIESAEFVNSKNSPTMRMDVLFKPHDYLRKEILSRFYDTNNSVLGRFMARKAKDPDQQPNF